MIAVVQSIEGAIGEIDIGASRLSIRWVGQVPVVGREYHLELDSDDEFSIGENALLCAGSTCLGGTGLEVVALLDSIDPNSIGTISFDGVQMAVELAHEGFIIGKVYKFIFTEIRAYDMNY